jgi:serine/threonine-protein kinase
MPAPSEARPPADTRLPRTGDVIAGKYRVDGFIARGGMGAVLSATHQVTGRRLALKWLLCDPAHDAEASHRLVREARAAARVRHPNVVDVYDIGEHEGALFLVMELLQGDTLSALLHARGKLDVQTTLELLLPTMHGVEAAHRGRVLHRDLKPSNIFLCRTDDSPEVTPRVLDFGISKIVTEAGDGERSLTRTGAALGTPQYMASEQLVSEDVDERADVYALGVIAYQCLSGRLPFQDTNYNALVLKIATATPPALGQLVPGLPPRLGAVVMRAMARDPGARFGNVAELIVALAPSQRPAARDGRPARSGRAWVLVAATAALLAMLAAWVILGEQGPIEPAARAWQPTPIAPAAAPKGVVPTDPGAGAAVQSAVAAAAPETPAAEAEPAARDTPAARAPSATSDMRRRRPTTQAAGPPTVKERDASGALETPEGPVPISPEQF